MCYNCGCFNPQDDMGNEKNITEITLEKLSEKWGKNIDEVKKTILTAIKENKINENADLKTMFEDASKAWGQSVEEAIDNTKDLLESNS